MPASAGDMASIPCDNEKGVWFVDRRGVVRCDHSTPSSSSAQAPFFLSIRFFSPATMVLLVASAWPFPCGYRGVDLLSLMFHVAQKFSNIAEVNWVPLSVTISYGSPCRQMMFFHTNFLTSSAWILAYDSASTHLVK